SVSPSSEPRFHTHGGSPGSRTGAAQPQEATHSTSGIPNGRIRSFEGASLLPESDVFQQPLAASRHRYKNRCYPQSGRHQKGTTDSHFSQTSHSPLPAKSEDSSERS